MKTSLPLLAIACWAFAACTQLPPEKPAVPASQSGVLQELLPTLANSYEDRIKLGTFAGTFLRPVDPSLKPYFTNLRDRSRALFDELKPLAANAKVDLRAKRSDGLESRARPIMEKRQEAFARAANQADFERDMLMHMYHESEWLACLIEAALPDVQDASLKSYLQKAMKAHRDMADETKTQLRRYKLQPAS